MSDQLEAKRRYHHKRLRRERIFLYVLVACLVTAVMFPFVWLLIMSFKPMEAMFAWPPELTFTPTLEHYIGLWDGDFPKSFWNSLVTSVGSTVAAMLLGVPGAYALSRMAYKISSRLSLLILASRMAPPIAFTIPYFLAYRYIGLHDTLTAPADMPPIRNLRTAMEKTKTGSMTMVPPAAIFPHSQPS